MENNINPGVVNNVSNVVEKKGKSGGLKFIIIFILVFAVAFAGGYFVATKLVSSDVTKCEETVDKETENTEEKVEETKCPEIDVDIAEAADFAERFTYISQNVFNTSYEHLIPTDKRNLNLLEDKVLNFRIAYYFAQSYSDNSNKKYDETADGEEVTGAYAIKYDAFKTYYKNLYGVDFDESVIKEVGESFVLKDNYLYGTIITGPSSRYELVAQSYVQSGDKYYFTVLVKELNDDEEVESSYNVKFELNSTNQILAVIAN